MLKAVGAFIVPGFYSEVIVHDPRFSCPSRINDLALLEPVTREKVRNLLILAGRLGIELMVYETYRSQQRQQELFQNGATKLQAVGVHHYGLACDVVRSINGEASWKGDFSFLGRLANSCGLIWGGDWGAPQIRHLFIDSVHVQRCSIGRQRDLFSGEWYPEETYDPYDDAGDLPLAGKTEDPRVSPPALAENQADPGQGRS